MTGIICSNKALTKALLLRSFATFTSDLFGMLEESLSLDVAITLFGFYENFIPVPFPVEYLLPDNTNVDMLKRSLLGVGVSEQVADIYAKSFIDLNRVWRKSLISAHLRRSHT